MKNKSLIIIGALLVAIIIIAGVLYPNLSQKASESLETTTKSSETAAFPKYEDIKIYDKDGKEVSLSDFEGKPVILNFWATWCGYCIQEMPDFQKAYEKYGDEIQFLIVNTDDGIKAGEKFISGKGYTFPTYYDLEYSAAITYGISGIPRTIAIDKDGFIRYNQSGMIDADALQSIIDMIK